MSSTSLDLKLRYASEGAQATMDQMRQVANSAKELGSISSGGDSGKLLGKLLGATGGELREFREFANILNEANGSYSKFASLLGTGLVVGGSVAALSAIINKAKELSSETDKLNESAGLKARGFMMNWAEGIPGFIKPQESPSAIDLSSLEGRRKQKIREAIEGKAKEKLVPSLQDELGLSFIELDKAFSNQGLTVVSSITKELEEQKVLVGEISTIVNKKDGLFAMRVGEIPEAFHKFIDSITLGFNAGTVAVATIGTGIGVAVGNKATKMTIPGRPAIDLGDEILPAVTPTTLGPLQANRILGDTAGMGRWNVAKSQLRALSEEVSPMMKDVGIGASLFAIAGVMDELPTLQKMVNDREAVYDSSRKRMNENISSLNIPSLKSLSPNEEYFKKYHPGEGSASDNDLLNLLSRDINGFQLFIKNDNVIGDILNNARVIILRKKLNEELRDARDTGKRNYVAEETKKLLNNASETSLHHVTSFQEYLDAKRLVSTPELLYRNTALKFNNLIGNTMSINDNKTILGLTMEKSSNLRALTDMQYTGQFLGALSQNFEEMQKTFKKEAEAAVQYHKTNIAAELLASDKFMPLDVNKYKNMSDRQKALEQYELDVTQRKSTAEYKASQYESTARIYQSQYEKAQMEIRNPDNYGRHTGAIMAGTVEAYHQQLEIARDQANAGKDKTEELVDEMKEANQHWMELLNRGAQTILVQPMN